MEKKIILNLLSKSIIYSLNKNINYLFVKISNINKKTVDIIFKKLCLNKDLKIKKMKYKQFQSLTLFINNELVDLYNINKNTTNNIKIQNLLNNYKAKRRRLGYPVNGQRTRTNARSTKENAKNF